jgi:simple sugar transport system substrate-binding protein/ribose transport system substrate-binding protein
MKKVMMILAVMLLITLPASMVMAKGAQAAPGGKQIAGIVFQEDQFMKLLALGYKVAADEAGYKILQANTANDQAKEAELINTYVAQKIPGLVIAPLDPATSVPVLRKASEAGMKIATTNSNLKDADFIVGGYTSDDENLGASSGKAAAKYIKEKLGGNGKIAILQFKTLLPNQSAARVNGFLNAVKKECPNVTVVADQDAWLQDKAVQVAGDILTAHKDVNVIYGANDGGTIGSVMAVRNAGLAGKVAVFGIDTGDQQMAMLKDPDNVLQAVTGQDPYTQGYNAAKVLISAIEGKDVSATKGKSIIVDGLLVSRDNPAGIEKFEKDLAEKLKKL